MASRAGSLRGSGNGCAVTIMTWISNEAMFRDGYHESTSRDRRVSLNRCDFIESVVRVNTAAAAANIATSGWPWRTMAEGVRFELTRGREPPAGFQDRCLKPLGHPSDVVHQLLSNSSRCVKEPFASQFVHTPFLGQRALGDGCNNRRCRRHARGRPGRAAASRVCPQRS